MTATVPALLAGPVNLGTMTEVFNAFSVYLNGLDLRTEEDRATMAAALPKLDEFARCITLLTTTSGYLLPNDVHEHIVAIGTEVLEALPA